MRKLSTNKLVTLILSFLLLINLTACKQKETYKVKDYLNELAYQSGIALNYEINESFAKLENWKVVKEEERVLLEDDLNYGYLGLTLARLLDEEEDGIQYLRTNNYLKTNKKDSALVSQEEALEVIKKVVEKINDPDFEEAYYLDEKNDIKHLYDYHLFDDQLLSNNKLEVDDYLYLEEDNVYKKVIVKENNSCKLQDVEIEEVLNSFYLAGSEEINFEEAEIIPGDGYTSLAYEETNYSNNIYTLLANKRHSFSKDGYDIAYSFKSGGLDVRVSKKIAKGPNMFFDISLSNVKPKFKWNFQEGKIKEAFLKLDFKLTNELGLSIGKYNDYYVDLKNKSADGFLKAIKHNYDYKEDELEATIKICTIKTSIPSIPFADLNLDVIAKIYTTGKIEIVLYNEGTIGFEVKDNNFRVVHDVDKDSDFIIGASARAVAGLNFNLTASQFRLMDIEFDAGIRAAVSSTLHLYDKYGNESEEESDIQYSILQELAKENPNVAICGDVSLNWVFDVQFNTSKTKLYKYGITYKKSFLNKNNQVFGNLTHIENGQLVKSCTHKKKNLFKTTTKETTKLNTNKIVLATYSKVIIKGDSYEIPILLLPDGYNKEDLTYYSSDSSIASGNNGIIEAYDSGSCSITIKTKDNKYQASINILVSTG